MSELRTKIRGAYEKTTRQTTPTVGISRTKQSFKRECDINYIMERWRKTGAIDHIQQNPGSFADVVGLPDYHDSMNAIIEAQEAFAALPAHVRKRFNHDPAELLDFIQHDDNREELIKLGLIDAPIPAPEPVEAPEPTPLPEGE